VSWLTAGKYLALEKPAGNEKAQNVTPLRFKLKKINDLMQLTN